MNVKKVRNLIATSSLNAQDATAFVALLKSCAKQKDLCKGSFVHADILKRGLLEESPCVSTALVAMYAKCGAFMDAKRLLDGHAVESVVAWSALIGAYAQYGHGEEALDCYEKMQSEGIKPNAVTYISVFKSCSSVQAVDKAEQIHAEIAKQGLLEKGFMLGTALVDMYAKCDVFAKAEQLHDELPLRDVVTWTALITWYAQHGYGEEALMCFSQMQCEGFSPNEVTFICALKACGHVGAVEKGELIHNEVIGQGLLAKNIVLGTALITMYANCGLFTKAQQVLDELPDNDAASWNALIIGYAEHGCGQEALNCLTSMQGRGCCPNAVTFTCVLKACGSLGVSDIGETIHAAVDIMGLRENNIVLGTSLLDMYAKCGALTKAQQVLDELPARNLVSWNALMAGYAQHGHAEETVNCFKRMQDEGLTPDAATFGCLLYACGHSGLLNEGCTYFASMSKAYGIMPNEIHYACIVDLFGRAGQFDEAKSVIWKSSCSNSLPQWTALLGACCKWENVTLGRVSFDTAEQLDEKHASAYVCMKNIYSAAWM